MIQSTSAPWAASVFPVTGAAITRLHSSTLNPLRQRSFPPFRWEGKLGGPGAIFRIVMGKLEIAFAWGWRSHSLYERRAEMTMLFWNAAVSKSSAFHFRTAPATSERVGARRCGDWGSYRGCGRSRLLFCGVRRLGPREEELIFR